MTNQTPRAPRREVDAVALLFNEGDYESVCPATPPFLKWRERAHGPGRYRVANTAAAL